jgi:hypothetical protein
MEKMSYITIKTEVDPNLENEKFLRTVVGGYGRQWYQAAREPGSSIVVVCFTPELAMVALLDRNFAKMSSHPELAKIGIHYGFLEQKNGQIVYHRGVNLFGPIE